MFVNAFTEESEELRKRFEFLRGSAVTAFANAEFLMKAFLVAFDEKADFVNAGGYYNTIESVVSNFKSIFGSEVIPETLRDEVHILIENFEKVIDDRNQFVHGTARLVCEKQLVIMKRFRPRKGKLSAHEARYEIITKIYNLDTLANNVTIFDDICRGLTSLILEIDLKLDLDIRNHFNSY